MDQLLDLSIDYWIMAPPSGAIKLQYETMQGQHGTLLNRKQQQHECDTMATCRKQLHNNQPNDSTKAPVPAGGMKRHGQRQRLMVMVGNSKDA
jgi:hypothetical protein